MTAPPGDVTPGELSRWLGRVERKLDKTLDDHEDRLRRIERYLFGAIAVVGLVSAIGGATIGVLVGRAIG
mgnify:CR=1 FL=1